MESIDNYLHIYLYKSENCGYCRQLIQTVNKIKQERAYVKIHVVDYNRDKHKEIKYTPSLVLFYQEQELGRTSSALSKKVLDNWLDQISSYIEQYLGSLA